MLTLLEILFLYEINLNHLVASSGWSQNIFSDSQRTDKALFKVLPQDIWYVHLNLQQDKFLLKD